MTIYRHTNTVTGLHYIGVTKYTMKRRWVQHLQAARRTDRTGSAFQNALRKYGKDSWTHHVIVENVPQYMVQAFEKYWVHKFDSFKNGYNSTEGGDYFAGYRPPQKINHHSFKQNRVTFNHEDGTIEVCYAYELAEKYNLNIASLNTQLCKGKIKYKGWYFNTKPIPKPIKIPKPKIPKFDYFTKRLFKEVVTKKYTFKLPLDSYIFNWYHPKRGSARYKLLKSIQTSGSNNGMYGKHRPQYVKEAVSKARRASADQTLRDWTHPTLGDELQITCIALRDKYMLNISHLNNIVKGQRRIKSYKGWKLK